MPILRSLAKITVGSALVSGLGWTLYTRNSHFVPISASSPSVSNDPLFKRRNPANNPLIVIDHLERRVPLSQLKTNDKAELTREFCAGVWSGLGFAVQRKYLENKYRALEGRKEMLWDVDELEKSDYKLGTKIADHFEVVDRDDGKVSFGFARFSSPPSLLSIHVFFPSIPSAPRVEWGNGEENRQTIMSRLFRFYFCFSFCFFFLAFIVFFPFFLFLFWYQLGCPTTPRFPRFAFTSSTPLQTVTDQC